MSKNVVRLADFARQVIAPPSDNIVDLSTARRAGAGGRDGFDTIRIAVVRERTELSLEFSRSR